MAISENVATRENEITTQNDRFRASWGSDPAIPGRIVVTAGVAALGPVAALRIMMAVRSFAAFTEDNDPWGQHDFGAFEIGHEGRALRLYWKIDLYDADYTFRKKGAKHTAGELVRHLAALLSVSDAKLGALVDAEAKTDIRAVWTPTAENFFARVSGGYLETLWRDLLGVAPDHPTATAFAKLRKGEKAARLESLFGDPDTRASLALTPEQEARVAAWFPAEAL